MIRRKGHGPGRTSSIAYGGVVAYKAGAPRVAATRPGRVARFQRAQNRYHVLRTFRYRLSPTRAQETRMRGTLELLRELYNAALQERIAGRRAGVNITCKSQQLELSEVRAVRPEFAALSSHLMQDVISRLDRAYQAFFRRVKAGETPGFPRFKGRGRYRTFTFKDAGNRNGVGICAGGKRVYLRGLGNVKIKLHRPIEGRIKTASVTLSGDGHWYIAFACDDVPAKPLAPTGQSIGVDVGITTFAALSDGELIANPRFFETAQREIAISQRRVTRRKLRSARRRKAVTLLAKRHDKIKRTRLDFQHKVALDLVRRFDSISVEKLNVAGLARGRLSKQILDASWFQFTSILAAKAESAGRVFFEVDPRGTSQRCSGCDAVVAKALAVRIHDCPHCGYVADRDVNAAKNIEMLGQSIRGGVAARGLADDPRSRYPAECGK
jgi:putative transposase